MAEEAAQIFCASSRTKSLLNSKNMMKITLLLFTFCTLEQHLCLHDNHGQCWLPSVEEARIVSLHHTQLLRELSSQFFTPFQIPTPMADGSFDIYIASDDESLSSTPLNPTVVDLQYIHHPPMSPSAPEPPSSLHMTLLFYKIWLTFLLIYLLYHGQLGLGLGFPGLQMYVKKEETWTSHILHKKY